MTNISLRGVGRSLRRQGASEADTRTTTLIAAALLWVLLWSATVAGAQAGTLTAVTDTEAACTHLFEGQVVEGDLEKFRQVWIETKGDDFKFSQAPLSVCFDSPGGSFIEGVRLAEFLKEFGIGTVVRSDARCLSACAIAFMGGTSRVMTTSRRDPSRELELGGVLGFHRPSVSEEQRASPGQTGEILDLGMEVAAALHALNKDGTVSDYLYQRILHTSYSDMFYIDTNTRAALAEVTVNVSGPLTLDNQHIVNLCINSAFILDYRDNVLSDISERAFGPWKFGAFWGGGETARDILTGRRDYLERISQWDEVATFSHYRDIMLPDAMNIFEGGAMYAVGPIAGSGVYFPPGTDAGAHHRLCAVQKLHEDNWFNLGSPTTGGLAAVEAYGAPVKPMRVYLGEPFVRWILDWEDDGSGATPDGARQRYMVDDPRNMAEALNDHAERDGYLEARELRAPVHLIYPPNTQLSAAMAAAPNNGPVQITFKSGRNQRISGGAPLASVALSSAADCALRCESRTDCGGYNFAGTTCQILGRVDALEEAEGAFFGVKVSLGAAAAR